MPWSEEDVVTCPVCGWDYVHIVSVRVQQNRDLVVVDSAGVSRVEAIGSSGRGSVVALRFFGECGHNWDAVHSFAKGRTFSEFVRRDDSVPAEDGSFDWPEELWRG